METDIKTLVVMNTNWEKNHWREIWQQVPNPFKNTYFWPDIAYLGICPKEIISGGANKCMYKEATNTVYNH